MRRQHYRFDTLPMLAILLAACGGGGGGGGSSTGTDGDLFGDEEKGGGNEGYLLPDNIPSQIFENHPINKAILDLTPQAQTDSRYALTVNYGDNALFRVSALMGASGLRLHQIMKRQMIAIKMGFIIFGLNIHTMHMAIQNWK